MICQTCGREVAPQRSDCDVCFTPIGEPAVRPGAKTYRVRVLGLAAGAAVALTVPFQAGFAAVPLLGRWAAQRGLSGAEPESDPFRLVTLTEVVLSLGHVVALLPAVVLVVTWCYRARKNLDAFPGSAPSMSPRWAIAGWVIPFANFVIPYRVVAETARASLWRMGTPWLVRLWWAAWLLYLLGDRAISRADTGPDLSLVFSSDEYYAAYLDYYTASVVPRILMLVVAGVAAAALIQVIRRVSAAQEARIDRGAPPPVMPGTHLVPQMAPGTGGGTIGA